MSNVGCVMLANALHHLNTVKGGRFISDSRLARTICGEGPALANLRCGSRAIVLLGDHVGRAMYLWGQHDPRVAQTMEAVIEAGDTILDIGANFGALGLLAARKAGHEGKVHLFEPLPLLAQCLRASLMLNGYDHAEVHECALSKWSGYSDLAIVEPGNLGMTRIAPSDSKLPGRRVRVRVENAAEYVGRLSCHRATLVKIDVEGHEGIILEALRMWLSDVVPRVLLFECHVGKAGFWKEQSVEVLAQLRYHLFAYDMTEYRRTRLYRVSKQNAFPAGYDFVAVHYSTFEKSPQLGLWPMILSQT